MKTNIKGLVKKGKMGEREVLTTDQVSMLLQMQPTAIRNNVRNGTLSALKIGNRLRFSKKALLESLDVKRFKE